MNRLLMILGLSVTFLWGVDASFVINKKEEVMPTLAIEEGTLQGSEFSRNFSKLLLQDMKVVSLFKVDESYGAAPYESNMPAFSHQNDQYILRYRIQNDGAGGVKADVRMLNNGSEIFVKTYLLKQSEMAVFLAHTIAYDINAKMGGAPMEWMKRKVLMTRLTGKKRSEIVVADYTLSYLKTIGSNGLFGFAKWANQQQTELYFTSLHEARPTIYKMELQTGKKEKLIVSDGMAVCSDVSNDGKTLLLTLAPNGQPDIYQFNTIDGSKVRVTDYSGIDVNGQFLGDGSIAFVSNRLGNPNIYKKQPQNSAVVPLVNYGKNNSSLSAYKNFLVYKSRENTGGGNIFNLHLLSLNSGSVQRLTNSGENDFPRFSPDGEAILFIKQEGHKSSVGVIRTSMGKIFTFPLKIGRIESIDW